MKKFFENIAWHWRYSRDKINYLPKKFRVIIFVIGLALIFILWHIILMASESAETQELKDQKTAVEAQIKILNIKLDKLNVDIKQIDQAKKEHAHLKSQLAKLSDQVNIFNDRVVSSQKMAGILKDILSNIGLTLNKLESSSAESLNKNDGDIVDASKLLYRKNINLDFVGNFYGTVSFFEKIESLNWQLFWDSLDYKVTKYPNADVVLGLHILSF